MEIMFEGTVAMGKHAFCMSGEIPKECSEGSGDSADGEGFLDPQCEPFENSVDPMEVEGPASSRARPIVNKGKGLASGVQLSGEFARNQERSIQPFKRCPTL